MFTKILTGLVIMGTAIVGAFQPAKTVDLEPQLGATISTTSVTDTIGKFRTDVNTSVTNINTQLEGISSTIGTYGTIALENTPLATNKGGTGLSTTPTDSQFLSVNGTSPIWKTLVGSGAISISTTTTSTIFSSTGFDQTGSYTFTGSNTFTSSTIFGATSTVTFNGTTNIAGTSLSIPTTTLKNGADIIDSNGNSRLAGSLIFATTTDKTISDTATPTVLVTSTLPANTIGKNGMIHVSLNAETTSMTNGAAVVLSIGIGTNSTSSIDLTNFSGSSLSPVFKSDFYIYGNNSTSSQIFITSGSLSYTTNANVRVRGEEKAVSFDSTIANTIYVYGYRIGADSINTGLLKNIIIQKIY